MMTYQKKYILKNAMSDSLYVRNIPEVDHHFKLVTILQPD